MQQQIPQQPQIQMQSMPSAANPYGQNPFNNNQQKQPKKFSIPTWLIILIIALFGFLVVWLLFF